jgi:hypothetical protein
MQSEEQADLYVCNNCPPGEYCERCVCRNCKLKYKCPILMGKECPVDENGNLKTEEKEE